MKKSLSATLIGIALLAGCAGGNQKTEAEREKPEIKILMALTEKDGVQGTWKTCTGISGMGLVLGTNISVRDENGKLVGTSSWENISEDGVAATARHLETTPKNTREWLEKNQKSLCILEADAEISGQPEAMEISILGEKYSVTKAELEKKSWTLNLGKGDYELLMEMSKEVKGSSTDKS